MHETDPTHKATRWAFLLASGLGLLTLALPFAILFEGLPALIPSKTCWLSFATGTALLTLAWCEWHEARRFGAVAALLILGSAAQLWLTQPLWFPALRLRHHGLADYAMIMLIAVQAVTAVTILVNEGQLARIGRLFGAFGLVKVLVFLALSGAFSVSVLGDMQAGFAARAFAQHLIAASVMIGINLATLAALLAQTPPRLPQLFGGPALPAAVALAAASMLAWFGFERMPHVEDELAYLFQARLFAEGLLTAPAPAEALRAGLDFYLLDIVDGRWIATPPPGWPAALAVGSYLGVPWLVNPLLAALSIFLGHAVATRLATPQHGALVVLLMCCSPWFLGTAGSLMPHSLALFLTLLAWWLLLAAATRPGPVFVAGLAMGWLFVTRQLEGVLIGTLTGLWLLARLSPQRRWSPIIAYGAGCIATGSAYLAVNFRLTGDILGAPLGRYLTRVWSKGANSYGFGADVGPPEGWGGLDIAHGHSPLEGLLNTLHNLSMLQLELFGAGIGSLALVWALLLWGKPTRADAMMAGVILAVIAALFFYWFSGSFYIGPRYWFSAFFPLVFLSASGALALGPRLTALGADPQAPRAVLVLVCLISLTVFIPWRGVTKYYGYGDFTATFRNADKSSYGNALVLVSTRADIGSVLFLNDPLLPADKPIFLQDLGGDQAAALADAFPGRQIIRLGDPR